MATSHKQEETSDDRDSSKEEECKGAFLRSAEDGWTEKEFWSLFEEEKNEKKRKMDDVELYGDTRLAYSCERHELAAELLFSHVKYFTGDVEIGNLKSALRNGCSLIVQALCKDRIDDDKVFETSGNHIRVFSDNELISVKDAYTVKAVKIRVPPFMYRMNWTSLQWSSNCGHYSLAHSLIQKGADINKGDWDIRTPLYEACSNGHLPVTQLLIGKGADVNRADCKGRTPLYQASGDGHYNIVQMLIKSGADVNKETIDGGTPLSWACYHGRRSVAKLLIGRGAEVNKVDINHCSPLFYACRNNYPSIAGLLVKNGADISRARSDLGTKMLFQYAVRRGKASVVRVLLKNGCDANEADEARGLAPLHIAARWGHASVARALLEHGADVDTCDSSGLAPLHLAIRGELYADPPSRYDGTIPTVKHLLEAHKSHGCAWNYS